MAILRSVEARNSGGSIEEPNRAAVEGPHGAKEHEVAKRRMGARTTATIRGDSIMGGKKRQSTSAYTGGSRRGGETKLLEVARISGVVKAALGQKTTNFLKGPKTADPARWVDRWQPGEKRSNDFGGGSQKGKGNTARATVKKEIDRDILKKTRKTACQGNKRQKVVGSRERKAANSSRGTLGLPPVGVRGPKNFQTPRNPPLVQRQQAIKTSRGENCQAKKRLISLIA